MSTHTHTHTLVSDITMAVNSAVVLSLMFIYRIQNTSCLSLVTTWTFLFANHSTAIYIFYLFILPNSNQ